MCREVWLCVLVVYVFTHIQVDLCDIVLYEQFMYVYMEVVAFTVSLSWPLPTGWKRLVLMPARSTVWRRVWRR